MIPDVNLVLLEDGEYHELPAPTNVDVILNGSQLVQIRIIIRDELITMRKELLEDMIAVLKA